MSNPASNLLLQIGGVLSHLITSSSAESLILGNKGIAGLAWASLGVFGYSSVVRGCISGACSGWQREFFGLRSKWSDLTVGMGLDLVRDSRSDRTPDDAQLVGISRRVDIDDQSISTRVQNEQSNKIYAFDYSISNMLADVPESTVGAPLHIFTYADYPFVPNFHARFQFLALSLSLLKPLEGYLLWRQGGYDLAFVTTIPWCYFFVVAAVLQIHALFAKPDSSGRFDILAGQLPAVKQAGGSKKLILGAAQNPRHSLWWRISWGVGACVCTGALLLSYIIVERSPQHILRIWGFFQVFWSGLRALFHHFSDPVDPMAHRLLVDQPWETLSSPMKARVLDLIVDLSVYQTQNHPRGVMSYREEQLSSGQISRCLSQKPLDLHFPLESESDSGSGSIDVNIVAIIGDVVLSSAAWLSGSEKSSLDLYDTCIVIFSVKQPDYTTTNLAIPSVRVLSGPNLTRPPDNHSPLFVPKGASNVGYGLSWWYWIPCTNGKWLQIRSEDMKVLGQRRADILTNAELTTKLAAGDLNIDLVHADNVEATLRLSRNVGEVLRGYVG